MELLLSTKNTQNGFAGLIEDCHETKDTSSIPANKTQNVAFCIEMGNFTLLWDLIKNFQHLQCTFTKILDDSEKPVRF